MVEHLPASKQVLLRNNNTMSDHIYSQFFSESTSSLRICQYVHCGATLTKDDQKKFCNLACCNRQNALKQRQEAEKRRAAKQADYEANPKKCLECDQAIPYSVTLNGPAKFCTHTCAAKFNNRVRPASSRQKQSATIKQSIENGQVQIKTRKDKSKTIKLSRKYPYSKITWKTCEVTGKPYHTRLISRGHRQKSPYAKTIKSIYYQLTKFKFNVYKMPELFDLALLNQLGWYTCPGKKRKNHIKNTAGVSRDHLYSISQGMENKIHPLLLSHPVNCKLVEHKKNKLKHSSCEITLHDLIQKIQMFDNEGNRFKSHDMILKIIENGQIFVDDWELIRKII